MDTDNAIRYTSIMPNGIKVVTGDGQDPLQTHVTKCSLWWSPTEQAKVINIRGFKELHT